MLLRKEVNNMFHMSLVCDGMFGQLTYELAFLASKVCISYTSTEIDTDKHGERNP